MAQETESNLKKELKSGVDAQLHLADKKRVEAQVSLKALCKMFFDRLEITEKEEIWKHAKDFKHSAESAVEAYKKAGALFSKLEREIEDEKIRPTI